MSSLHRRFGGGEFLKAILELANVIFCPFLFFLSHPTHPTPDVTNMPMRTGKTPDTVMRKRDSPPPWSC